MMRYTTPYHRFKLPITDFSTIKLLYITYAQDGKTLFEKTIDDCTYLPDTNQVEVHLTQEETALCDSRRYEVEVQVTFKTKDGNRFTSNIINISSGRVLKEGEI